jgi:predicted ATPase
MRITGIRIIGLQQFGDVSLDFTHPETREPLDKICFIGQNGTGKSTILRILFDFINNGFSFTYNTYRPNQPFFLEHKNFDFISVGVSVEINNIIESFYFCSINKEYSSDGNSYGDYSFILDTKIDNIPDWRDALIHTSKDIFLALKDEFSDYYIQPNTLQEKSLLKILKLKNNSNDLLIYCPSESTNNLYLQIEDVPNTTLNNAQLLFREFQFSHVVSDEKVTEFWQLLIFLIKKRENDREKFENDPENINKTKKELIDEFEKISPKILNGLAKEWDKILNKTGLYFDADSASNPIQLNDNLRAYIKHKSSGEQINYNQLSTGIRNFIFKIGHIYALYFNRKIDKGFLFFDEPENSLFPDFLFELVKTIQTVVLDKNRENNTQLFISTHNPIIAAQFQPYERIIFNWNDANQVSVKKGTTPIGDDPNDILSADFMLKNLMGEEGLKKWDEYIKLKKELARDNSKNKDELTNKILKIGKDYNF